MAQVIWSTPALQDLDHIQEYIQHFDPTAAVRIYRNLIEAGYSLAEFPSRGRPVRAELRELPTVPPYVILYEVVGEEVHILNIRHGRQRPSE